VASLKLIVKSAVHNKDLWNLSSILFADIMMVEHLAHNQWTYLVL